MFETLRKVLPCLVALAVTALTVQTARADLIGHWTFDDTYVDLAQGNTALDNWGVPTFSTDKAAGTHSLSVTAATNAAALVGNLPAGASPRTLSFWMKADGVQAQAPVSWGSKQADPPLDNGAHLFEVLTLNDSTLIGHFWGSGMETTGVAQPTYADNQWLHVAMTYDGANVRVYSGGALVGSPVNLPLNTTPGFHNPSNPIFFGGGNSWFGYSDFASGYSGLIDDVQIYDQALTDAEVDHLYQNPGESIPDPVTPTVPITENLEGYWQFEDNYVDSTGNNDMEAIFNNAGPTFNAGQVGNSAVVLSGAAGGNWEYLRTQNAITSAVTGGNARTLNVWFRSDADQFSAPVSYGVGANAGDLFEVLCLNSGHSAGQVYGGHFWGGGNDTYLTPPANPAYTVGEWSMATLVYGGTGTVDVYANGQFIKTSVVAINTTPGVGNDVEDLLVGASNWAIGGFFVGAVDDVALWSRTLSADEVEAIYDAGVAGDDLYAIPEPSSMMLLILGVASVAIIRRRRSA